MTLTSPEQPRLPALDGLRALACLMVFAVHFGQITRLQGQWGVFDLRRLLDNGNTGVALFFTLSAFLLSTPYWLAMRHQRDWPPLGNYWLMRLARVLPAYYLCLLALVVANRLWRQDDAALNLLLHAGFVFNLSEAHAMRINPPFWTLAVELQFYLLLPGLMGLLKGSDPRRAAWVLVLLAALVYALHAVVMGLSLLPPLVGTYSLLAHLPHFLLGMATAAWCCTAPAPPAGESGRRRLLMGLVGLMLLLVLSTPLDNWLSLPHGRYNLPVVPAALCVLVALAARAGPAAGGVLAGRPLRALGAVSYAVYLFHLPVMHLTERLMPRVGLSAQADWALFGAMTLAATLLLAALSWLCVERPVLRTARRHLNPAPLH